jgi:hypothetical protein
MKKYSVQLILFFSISGLFQTAGVRAQEKDLSFVAAIKGSRFDQGPDQKLTLSRYFFFTEIFLTKGGQATDASLRRADTSEDPWRFEPNEEVLTFAGGYFPTLEELDEAFPDDRYILDLTTPSGSLQDQIVAFAPPGTDYRLPDPVTIHLMQDGKKVAPQQVDPEKLLSITWSEFEGGRTDPNGIVDDLIFVIVTDSNGKRCAHSGRPFSGSPFLTYETNSYGIPPERLEPGMSYTAVVEHARVINSDTSQSVPVFASYATVTYMTFRTTN